MLSYIKASTHLNTAACFSGNPISRTWQPCELAGSDTDSRTTGDGRRANPRRRRRGQSQSVTQPPPPPPSTPQPPSPRPPSSSTAASILHPVLASPSSQQQQQDVLAVVRGRPVGGHQDGEARRHLRPRREHLGPVRRLHGEPNVGVIYYVALLLSIAMSAMARCGSREKLGIFHLCYIYPVQMGHSGQK